MTEISKQDIAETMTISASLCEKLNNPFLGSSQSELPKLNRKLLRLIDYMFHSTSMTWNTVLGLIPSCSIEQRLIVDGDKVSLIVKLLSSSDFSSNPDFESVTRYDIVSASVLAVCSWLARKYI